MLEVILENARGQCWAERAFLTFHGAHDFSATDNLGLRKAGNLGWEHEIDFQL